VVENLEISDPMEGNPYQGFDWLLDLFDGMLSDQALAEDNFYPILSYIRKAQENTLAIKFLPKSLKSLAYLDLLMTNLYDGLHLAYCNWTKYGDTTNSMDILYIHSMNTSRLIYYSFDFVKLDSF